MEEQAYEPSAPIGFCSLWVRNHAGDFNHGRGIHTHLR